MQGELSRSLKIFLNKPQRGTQPISLWPDRHNANNGRNQTLFIMKNVKRTKEEIMKARGLVEKVFKDLQRSEYFRLSLTSKTTRGRYIKGDSNHYWNTHMNGWERIDPERVVYAYGYGYGKSRRRIR